MYLTRTKGRSKVGEKCRQPVSNQRGRHLSVTMAVCGDQGMVLGTPQIGGVKKADFVKFLEDLGQKLEERFQTLSLLENPKPFIVFFDNCPAHRGTESVMEKFPHVSVKRLPKYSPEINVIENCFSFYKARMKQLLRRKGPVERQRLPTETLLQCRSRILL